MITATRTFETTNVDLTEISRKVKNRFGAMGYDTTMVVSGNEYTVCLKKGNMFRKVLGLQTSLNVTLSCMEGFTVAQTSVGFFGTQAIPTIITLFVTWPVIIPQIVGIIKSLKLDDEVLDYISEQISIPVI